MFDVLRSSREFRVLALTETLSVVGDQLSRVALALLVFGRTGSAALGALTYALTFLPTVLGGILLSPLADRMQRRGILVTIDGLRAAAVLAMAAPGRSLPALCCLVAVSSFLSGPYRAARLALLRDVLSPEQYGAGMTLRQSLSQGAQLIGFCSGGLLAAAFSPATCLLIDSATFAASAVAVRFFVQGRPAALAHGESSAITATVELVWRSLELRTLFLSTFMGFFLLAPEALAAPLASELALGAQWVGFFMASGGLFSVAGLVIFTRFVKTDQYSRTFPVAIVLPGLPLLLLLVTRNPVVIVALFGLSGAAWSILTVVSSTSFAERLPNRHLGRGMGLAGSANATTQGVGAALGGLAADVVGAAPAIALLGLGAVAFALGSTTLWKRATRTAGPSGELSTLEP